MGWTKAGRKDSHMQWRCSPGTHTFPAAHIAGRVEPDPPPKRHQLPPGPASWMVAWRGMHVMGGGDLSAPLERLHRGKSGTTREGRGMGVGGTDGSLPHSRSLQPGVDQPIPLQWVVKNSPVSLRKLSQLERQKTPTVVILWP